MGKCFAFSSRAVKMEFFEEKPIVITAFIGDDMDKRIMDSGKLIAQADKDGTDGRMEKYTAALALLVGKEKTAELLSRAPEQDYFSVLELWQYIVNCYREQKTKNLSAPAR